MANRQRKFKSHENVHGHHTINSGQVSKTFTPMKNVRFWKQVAECIKNEDWSPLEEQSRQHLKSNAWKRKNRLNEVSYKSKYNN